MASRAGFEPATLCLEGRCSVQLSYQDDEIIVLPSIVYVNLKYCLINGAVDRDRTGGLILTKDVLYQLSYDSTIH